MNIFQAPSCPT